MSAGQHPMLVRELLGHSQITVTLDTYSHVGPMMPNQIAGALEKLLAEPSTAAAEPSG